MVGACHPAAVTTAPNQAAALNLDESIARARIDNLLGEWRWMHSQDEAGVHFVESERWQFVRRGPLALGRYVRELHATSTDGRPFGCSQTTSYQQRASFDLTVDATTKTLNLHEVGFHAEPSPCDHGFRQLTDYQVELNAATAVLHYPGGEQRLIHVGPEPSVLDTPTWAGDTPNIDGRWQWSAVSRDGAGRDRHESETWVLSRTPDEHVSAQVTRTINVVDPDGAIIPCAGASHWQVAEHVHLEGYRLDERYLIRETEVLRDVSPCLPVEAKRIYDSAFAIMDGDHLELTWRGNRRQLLTRP